MANSCYGPLGNGVGFICYGFAELLTSKQLWHALQNLSTSLSTPGNNTLEGNRCRLFFHTNAPGCPSWARASILGLSLLGITIVLPRRINLPITQFIAYISCSGHLSSFHSLCIDATQQILLTKLLRFLVSSFLEGWILLKESHLTSHIISSHSYEPDKFSSATLSNKEGSERSSTRSRHDNGGAIFCCPGEYLTINPFRCNRKIHLLILAHDFDRLECILSKGLRSVYNSNSIPYRHTWKHSHAQITTYTFFSVWEKRFSASLKLLLA